MKITVTLLILLTLFSLTTFAQDNTKLSLPDGAKMRCGRHIEQKPDSQSRSGQHIANGVA